MRFLFSLIGLVYSSLIKLAVPFNPKARMMVRGRWKVWRQLREGIVPGGRYIWFHAASLGEFEQGRPMIERIRSEYPDYRIVLTFFSPSGYEVRKNYEGADVIVYLPADRLPRVRKFLDLVKPEMAIFIKYDFWPCFLTELERRQIPTYLVSSIFRPSQLFFRWYGGAYKRLLHCFTHIFVQDEASRLLLEKHGIDHVSVAGDTRFDRVISVYDHIAYTTAFHTTFGSYGKRYCPAGLSDCRQLRSPILHLSLRSSSFYRRRIRQRHSQYTRGRSLWYTGYFRTTI